MLDNDFQLGQVKGYFSCKQTLPKRGVDTIHPSEIVKLKKLVVIN